MVRQLTNSQMISAKNTLANETIYRRDLTAIDLVRYRVVRTAVYLFSHVSLKAVNGSWRPSQRQGLYRIA